MGKSILVGNSALAGFGDIFQSTVVPVADSTHGISKSNDYGTYGTTGADNGNSGNNVNSGNSGNSANKEIVVEIPLEELHPPEFHPFQVNDDLSMTRLSENIKRYGVREPGLVRPRVDSNGNADGYELLCGNRRKRACEIIGKETMPVIIREMDDDSAVICMVDSNLEQREKILPSEKAWAYKFKMEALNHNGVKADMHSVEVLIEQTGESKNQIFRLIRLTELIITLLDKVDARQLAFNSAVELSYLSQVEQTAVAEAMEKYEVKPSVSQAIRLKKLKQAGELTIEMIDEILAETKKLPQAEPKDAKTDNSIGTEQADNSINAEQAGNSIDTEQSTQQYRRFFPPSYSAKQIDSVITSLLKGWQAEQGVAMV